MSEEGVWRIIKGRRVFIRKGQSLSDAMRESGKFNQSKKDKKNKKDDKNVIDDNIENFSNKIVNKKKESAIIFDDNGNEIIFKDGEISSVHFNGEEMKKMRGMNLTHNHPSSDRYGGMFSKADLVSLYDNELKSMTAITQDGTIITLKRDKNIATDNEHKPGFLAGDYEREHIKRTAGKSLNELENITDDMNNWLNENAEKYGYRYERKINQKSGEIKNKNVTTIQTKKYYSDEELYKMNSKQLAILLVEDQIKRGVVKPENKELQIKMRLTGSTKMSKMKLLEYVKKNITK